MKRFLLFGSVCYYAGGGFADYIADFNSAEDAEAKGMELIQLGTRDCIEWWHVFDSREGRIVAFSGGAYGSEENNGEKINKHLFQSAKDCSPKYGRGN